MEEEDLIYAEKVRTFVRRLAMEREVVFGGNFHFYFYLYFQRTLPSFVSSSMIPDSASCWRI
jgi:hypothetical protein